MRPLYRWMLYVFGIITALFVAAAILLNRYEQEILGSLTRKLNESIDGQLVIGTNRFTIFHRFPDLSVSLRDVRLSGPESERSLPPVLVAGRIDINVSLFQLFRSNLTIRSIDIANGGLVILKTPTHSNLNIFKNKNDTTKRDTLRRANRVHLALDRIRIDNFRAQLIDSVKGKFIDLQLERTINQAAGSDTTIAFHVGGDIFVHGLTLNAEKGTFLKGVPAFADLNFTLQKGKRTMKISPSTLTFSTGSVEAEGLLAFGQSTLLRFKANPIGVEEALTLLNDSLSAKLARYHLDNKVRVDVTLNQRAPRTPPLLDIAFSFDSSAVTAGKISMSEMSVAGSYTNHLDTTQAATNSNSRLQFSSMRGAINNVPMTGEATITDFADPYLDLKATFDTPLNSLNENFDTTRYRMLAGHFNSSFTYSGKLREYLDETRTQYEGKLSGEATITGGKFHYVTRDMILDKVDARFDFTEKKFTISKLALLINKSPVSFQGSISDFIPFFTVVKDQGKVNLSIQSPRLDITGLLKPRKVKRSTLEKSSSRKRLSHLVETLSASLEFNVGFSIKEFINGPFRAQNAKGTLIMADDRFIIQKTNLGFGRGQVAMNLNVTGLNKDVSPFHLDANLREVEIKEFFHAFRDFNQKALRENNLSGKLTMDIQLSSALNDTLAVIRDRISGRASFSVVDGRLTDFEPLQRLSSFLFKNRDFSDVQFAEVYSNINLNQTRIEIERMEVQSTAISMFIEGTYDLKDSTDLSIQIPLSNIKKRDQNIPPENIGTDAKVGPSVFLRARPSKAGKTEISYDPFKKLRKKNA